MTIRPLDSCYNKKRSSPLLAFEPCSYMLLIPKHLVVCNQINEATEALSYRNMNPWKYFQKNVRRGTAGLYAGPKG